MHEQSIGARLVHENLNTAFVNLAALLRWLRQRGFVGRVHVELDEYDADVLLSADDSLGVRERNRATGLEAEGEAALHRLLVRAREPGGSISVYEEAATEKSSERRTAASFVGVYSTDDATPTVTLSREAGEDGNADAVQLTGELIQAVERGVTSASLDFTPAFHLARLSLAGDYPFLDPAMQRFTYQGGTIHISPEVNIDNLAQGVSEALRHMVDRVAAGNPDGEREVRGHVAQELAALADHRQKELTRLKLMPQLERIAGSGVR